MDSEVKAAGKAVSRRRFLTRGALAVGLGALSLDLLTACTGPTASPPAQSGAPAKPTEAAKPAEAKPAASPAKRSSSATYSSSMMASISFFTIASMT